MYHFSFASPENEAINMKLLQAIKDHSIEEDGQATRSMLSYFNYFLFLLLLSFLLILLLFWFI